MFFIIFMKQKDELHSFNATFDDLSFSFFFKLFIISFDFRKRKSSYPFIQKKKLIQKHM